MKIKIVDQETYLGDQVGLTVAESIALTLKRRVGLVKKSIFEIKTIVEDFRSKVVGGIATGILLWVTFLIPFLLYNLSTWLQMKKKEMETLSKIQRLFLNTLLGVKNCPAALMLWDLGILKMPMRILKEKVLLYHHISCLQKNSLAHQMMMVQEDLNFPSLRDEVKSFLYKFEITDVTQFSKKR